MNWVETHGVTLLVAAYVYSLIVSAMPPLPTNAGWWVNFLHNALQVTAANADRVVKSSPTMQRFTSHEELPNGASKTETLVTSAPVGTKPPV